MSELVVFYRGQPILREALTSALTIGSGPQCDIRLVDSVQACHAKIEISSKGFLITEVDGQVFMSSKRIIGSQFLHDGDLFDLGSYRFQILESSQSWTARGRKDETITENQNVDKKDSIPALYFLSPFKKIFQQIGLIIGRSPACDIVLDNPYVSTRHAEIFVREGKYFIRDLDSRNGVFINDFRATETPLPAAGTIRLGRLNLTYQIEIPSLEEDSIPGIEIPGPTPQSKKMIVHQSQAFKSVLNKLKMIAPSNDTILLLGETGVGKDVLASFVHHENPKRKNYPFIIVNCATITSTIAESLLFGHVKGSFTGADNNHKGYFEQADHGTLFLDEVGELPLESQARLLRVLEDKVIRPVGSNRQIPVDVRIIAATNRDLESAQRLGGFRQDLYERFDWIIKIPSLRERIEDIEPLIRYFLSSFSPIPISISPQLIAFLQKLQWSGNIRALQRSVRTAITNTVSRGSSELLQDDFEFREQTWSQNQPISRSLEPRQDKKDQFLAALVAHEGVVRKAVRQLGISTKTAYEMIKEHDIDLGFLRKK